MFTISFKVSNAKLADTLVRLNAIAPNVNVSADEPGQLQQTEQPSASQVSNGAVSPRIKVKKHYRLRPEGSETQEVRASKLILSQGESFRAKNFLDAAERNGINSAAAYRALKAAIDSGLLVRAEPGLYQRASKAA